MWSTSCAADDTKDSNDHAQSGKNAESKEKPVIIWFHNVASTEARVLEKAVSSGIVTHVWVLYFHPVDAPLAGLKNVPKAVKICKKYNVKVIWARTLWPNYEVKNFRRADISDPNYYKNFIELIRAEARVLGADFTGVDAEPYGIFPFKEIGGKPLIPKEYYAVKQAVQKTIKEKGQLDFIMPAGGAFPYHMYEVVRDLAKLKIAEHTYYDIPKKITDKNRPYDVLGAYINVSKYNPNYPKAPFFTLHEILERQQLWAHKHGLMLYPKEDRAEQIAEMLCKISHIQPMKTTKSGQ